MKRRLDKRERLEGLAAVAARFKSFRPAREVLTAVRAVPTCFVQLDHATRVGGLPIERFMLAHGPSNEGKSLAMLGLLGSFLRLDHFGLYIDAERTTPITWVAQLLGGLADHPGFYAMRPGSYEETIAKVRHFLTTVAELKAKKQVHPDTSALVVCDSLRKLVPEGLLGEILDYEKASREGKVKGGNDRGAQLKAKMNAAWMDELVPLLEHAGAGFVAIAREMVDPDNTNPWSRKFGTNYKVGSGGAVFYDASLVIRVERAGWVQEKTGAEGERPKVYGERHRMTIRKTKVGGKDDKVTTCAFHSSNGNLVPFGFDRARDVLELAQRFGLTKMVKGRGRGSKVAWGRERWAGEHDAVRRLTADPGMLADLEREVRAVFADHRPAEHDAQTGEVDG